MANPFDLAASQLGMNEQDQNAALQEYLNNGGVNLDPAVTAWCAAFVNASLSQAGIKGTGSNLARDFLKWGQEVSDPQRGDLAVFSRGDPNGPYGHVGFFDGYNPDGSIRLLGGNQGSAGEVSYGNYPVDRLLGFRRADGSIVPPGAGGGAADSGQAAMRPAMPQGTPLDQPEMTMAQKFAGIFDGTYKPNMDKLSEGIASAFAEPQVQAPPLQMQPRPSYQAPDRIGQVYELLSKMRGRV